MRLSVLGTGYLGATRAACMAHLGHEVVGIDADPAKAATEQVSFYEPDLPEALREGPELGQLTTTTDNSDAVDDVATEQHVIEARDALDPARWQDAGWTYCDLCRPLLELLQS